VVAEAHPDRISEALQLVEAGELGQAADTLGPLIRGKRHIRASNLNAEQDEVDEVMGWLRAALADPGSSDSRFFVERAYYKLRTQRQAAVGEDARRPPRRP
jgi:hypothetical protein